MGRVMKEVLKSFSLVQAFLLALYCTQLQILNELWCLNEPKVKKINSCFILIMACVVTETVQGSDTVRVSAVFNESCIKI